MMFSRTAALIATAALAISIVSLSPPAAHGQNDDAKQRARQHGVQGAAFFKAKEFARAATEFGAAYRLTKAPLFLFNIGLCHENLGELALAADHYRRYLVAEPRGTKSVEARARLAALDRKLAEQKQVAEKKAAIDRRLQAAESHRLAGRYQEAADELLAAHKLSGDSDLVFQAAERLREGGLKDAARGRYQQYLSIDDARRYRIDAEKRLRELDKGDHNNIVTPPPPPPSPQPRGSLTLPLVLYGVSAGLLAAGVGFGVRSGSLLEDIDDEAMTPSPPLDSRDSRFDDGKRAALIANISYGAAAATAVVASVLLWRALSPSGESSGVKVAPAVGAGSAAAFVEVTF